MAGVAQLVRAPDCGSGGQGFDSLHSPHKQNAKAFFFCEANEELRRTLGSLRQPKCERFWTVVFGNLEEIEAFKYKS